MTLPQFIVRGDGTQKQQQRDWKSVGSVPSVKHVDLLNDRGNEEIGNPPLEIKKAPLDTNPQKHDDPSAVKGDGDSCDCGRMC